MKIHHIFDDKNLLYVSSSPKDMNQKVNFDLSNLSIESTKQITKKMNFRLNVQKNRQKTCTKYLGLKKFFHALVGCDFNFDNVKFDLRKLSGFKYILQLLNICLVFK